MTRANNTNASGQMDKKRICVLGGGAWGTALAVMAVNLGHDVSLYARDVITVDEINTCHMNTRYLPNIMLPKALTATTDIKTALSSSEIVLGVIPAQTFSSVLETCHHNIPPHAPFVLCTKGIEQKSGRFMSDIAEEYLPHQPIAALSGPSFATDVVRGLPTAVTIASKDKKTARALAQTLSGSAFRCYASDDLIGVEIGGALKNVLALAAGISAGRQLGASAQAALITRGFAELRRIAVAMGGKNETMTGLSVLGDLILTCSSSQSRNYSYGFALGAGQSTEGLALAEGVATAPIAANLCKKHNIEAPVVYAIAALLENRITVDDAINGLINRPLKFED